MANPVASFVGYVPAIGGRDGRFVVDLTWTTYAQDTDVLDLSPIISRMPWLDLTTIVDGAGDVSASGEQVTFVPAASPTTSNVGVLRVFAGASQQAAGAFAKVARAVFFVMPKNGL